MGVHTSQIHVNLSCHFAFLGSKAFADTHATTATTATKASEYAEVAVKNDGGSVDMSSKSERNV